MYELSSLGDKRVSDLLGETTYNDLRNSMELSADSIETVANKIFEIETALLGDISDAQEKALIYQKNIHEQTLNEISYIYEAHNTQMAAAQQVAYMTADEALAQHLTNQIEISRTGRGTTWLQQRDEQGRQIMGSGAAVWKYTDPITGQTYKSMYVTAVDAKADIQNQMLSMSEEHKNELLAVYQSTADEEMIFTNAVLDNVLENNSLRLNDEIETNNAILSEMGEFTNAREELFFGERANFTGSLFREVKKGGIENLLYKTEILQTNNFFGVTLEETIDIVSDGVVQQLRNVGIPI